MKIMQQCSETNNTRSLASKKTNLFQKAYKVGVVTKRELSQDTNELTKNSTKADIELRGCGTLAPTV